MIEHLTVRRTMDAKVRERTCYAGFLASLLASALMGMVVLPCVGLGIVTCVAVLDALRARRARDQYIDDGLALARVIRPRADPLNIDFH